MATALEVFQEAKRKLDEAREVCKANAKAAFSEAAEALFAKHTELEAFSWTQYTPYFNDGDACVFSASTDYPALKMVGEARQTEDDDEDWHDNQFSSWTVSDKAKKGVELTAEELAGVDVVAFLEQFSEDDFEDMFGDHVRVVVKRGDVTVEDYSHD